MNGGYKLREAALFCTSAFQHTKKWNIIAAASLRRQLSYSSYPPTFLPSTRAKELREQLHKTGTEVKIDAFGKFSHSCVVQDSAVSRQPKEPIDKSYGVHKEQSFDHTFNGGGIEVLFGNNEIHENEEKLTLVEDFKDDFNNEIVENEEKSTLVEDKDNFNNDIVENEERSTLVEDTNDNFHNDMVENEEKSIFVDAFKDDFYDDVFDNSDVTETSPFVEEPTNIPEVVYTRSQTVPTTVGFQEAPRYGHDNDWVVSDEAVPKITKLNTQRTKNLLITNFQNNRSCLYGWVPHINEQHLDARDYATLATAIDQCELYLSLDTVFLTFQIFPGGILAVDEKVQAAHLQVLAEKIVEKFDPKHLVILNPLVPEFSENFVGKTSDEVLSQSRKVIEVIESFCESTTNIGKADIVNYPLDKVFSVQGKVSQSLFYSPNDDFKLGNYGYSMLGSICSMIRNSLNPEDGNSEKFVKLRIPNYQPPSSNNQHSQEFSDNNGQNFRPRHQSERQPSYGYDDEYQNNRPNRYGSRNDQRGYPQQEEVYERGYRQSQRERQPSLGYDDEYQNYQPNNRIGHRNEQHDYQLQEQGYDRGYTRSQSKHEPSFGYDQNYRSNRFEHGTYQQPEQGYVSGYDRMRSNYIKYPQKNHPPPFKPSKKRQNRNHWRATEDYNSDYNDNYQQYRQPKNEQYGYQQQEQGYERGYGKGRSEIYEDLRELEEPSGNNLPRYQTTGTRKNRYADDNVSNQVIDSYHDGYQLKYKRANGTKSTFSGKFQNPPQQRRGPPFKLNKDADSYHFLNSNDHDDVDN